MRTSPNAPGPKSPRALSALGCVVIVIGLFLATAPIALAHSEHVFSTTFAGSVTNALSKPIDVAVDNSTGPSAGDVYVSDLSNDRVEKFTPAGEFILMFGKEVNKTKVDQAGSTEAEQNVCTAASGDECQAGVEPPPSRNVFYPPYSPHYYLAVDPSSGPSSGDVYVGDNRDGVVSKYSPQGELIESWANGGHLEYTELIGMAIDPAGKLFVLAFYALGEREPTLYSFEPNGSLTGSELETNNDSNYFQPGIIVNAEDTMFKSPGERTGHGEQALTGMTYDASTNLTYAIENSYGGFNPVGPSSVVVYETLPNAISVNENGSPSPVAEFGEGDLGGPPIEPEPSYAKGRGIGIDEATGTVYVSDIEDDDIVVFQEAISPEVTTGPAEELRPTAATLTGSAEPAPGGGEVTACAFEYTTESSLAQHGYAAAKAVACAPPAPYSEPTEVTAEATGLIGGVTYDYRLIASDNGNAEHSGGTNHAEGLSFTTPLSVLGLKTEAPEALLPTSAVLRGSFEGNGEATECSFQWGEGSVEEHQTPLQSAGSPAVGETAHVSYHLGGLKLETKYRYRIRCENGRGPSQGTEEPFTTPPAVATLKTEPPEDVTPTTATLTGSFEGDGEDTRYYFKWGIAGGSLGETTAEEDAGSPIPGETATVSFELTGLSPGKAYSYRIVAVNGFGTTIASNEESLTTPVAKPAIGAESVTDVHSEGALLHAEINPESGSTTYHFEYDTAPYNEGEGPHGTSAPVPDALAGSGGTVHPFQLQLSGLAPATTYHYRVVAQNEAGAVTGPDRTFTTFPYAAQLKDTCPNALARQQTGAALLLDCRAYELVSAANTGGYPVEADEAAEGEVTPFGGYPEAESPPRVLYTVNHGAIPGTNHPTNKGSDPYVATRTEKGWSTEYVGVPADDPFATGPFSSVPAGADAGLDAFAFGAPGGCSPCFEGGYTGIPVRFEGKLVQGMAGSLDPGPTAKPAGYIAKDLSANGEHLVFGSTSRFEPEGNAGEISIYDRNLKTEETHVVSKTPGGATMKEEDQEIAELDISADGSHILIGKLSGESEGAKLYHLYMDVGDSATTIDLTPGASEGVRFDGMSADGTEVFFTTTEALHTAAAQDTDTSADIYMWSQQGEAEGEPLTRISTGAEGTGNTDACDPVAIFGYEHWNTRGSQANCGVLAIGGGAGAAAEGGAVYFLSPEQLDGSSHGVQNAPNLYLGRPGQGPRFIATLESSLTGPPQSLRHPFLRSFGSFSKPTFLAVDSSSEDVYVADTASGTIYKFDSAGNPVTGWREGGKLAGQGGIEGMAVDPSNGDLYVDRTFEVRVLSPAGALIRSFYVGNEAYGGFAVDSAGDLYLAGGFEGQTHGIFKSSPTGEYLGAVLTGVSPTGLALDPSNGDLYLDEEGGSVVRYAFNGAGEAVAPHLIASELSGASALAVNPAHDLYVDEGNQVLEFDSSGEESSAPIGSGRLHSSKGIAVGPAGELYAGNPSHSDLAEFGPPEAAPNPRADNPLVRDALTEPEARHTADFQLTPSGEFAAFASTLPLTGYESSGYPEVFRYDAATEAIDCVSCDPSGAEASGGASLASNGSSLTEAGQVFFDSEQALALRDSDNLADIYEWEPAGTGSCDSESPAFSKASGDCLDLISTGASQFASSLLGVSANGADAYFFTRDTLAPSENGELVKIYDARENGGFFLTSEPPLCRSSDECHGAGSAPPPPPGFHVNNGTTGNEPPATKCKKGFVEKHGKCVRKPTRHKHGHHHHKRGKHHRGGRK